MNLVFYIFVFIFGLCIGSFLNCIIYRLEKKDKLTGRSYCPSCKNNLSWHDLFPVLSFLWLKGKCRHCKTKISWQYPIVEILTGLIFLLIFDFVSFNFLNLLFYFYVASSLIVIFVYDLKYYIIPDKVLFPAIIITFIHCLFRDTITGGSAGDWTQMFVNCLFAVLVGAGFFLFIFLISRGRWMGFGDVKLAVLMGLLLGLPNILVALFLAFFFGAIIGTIMMVFKRKNLKSELPFGPFLITGTFIALFWGQQIVSWYLKLFSV